MISIIMSIYNEELNWIKESIGSILNQTYKDFEFIIVIDNPNLETKIVNYLFDCQKDDSRIILLFNDQNVGLAESLNRALKSAHGEFIARMDADDISLPNRLEIELDYLLRGYDMVFSNKINIDEYGIEIRREPEIKRVIDSLPYGNFIIHPTILAKKSIFDELNGYRNMRNSEDYDLWLRMLNKNKSIGIINEYLLLYRIRNNSASVGRNFEQYLTNKYIVNLFWKEKRTGSDVFSEIDLINYLNRKHAYEPHHKRRFDKAYNHLTKAYEFFEKGLYWSVFKNLFLILFEYPNLFFDTAYNTMNKYRISKTR